MTAKTKFFPNLNGLRFFAAFAVIIHHIEQTKWLYGYANHFFNPTILLFGSLGVTLFFVLSGFLITYLLIREKETNGSVRIRKFYTRRILRIWPLYYAIVISGLWILPHIAFFNFPVWSTDLYYGFNYKVLFFLLILPNVALIQYPPMPYMKQTWSIGVEEQFYIIWPIIIKFSKNYLSPLLVIVFGFMLLTDSLFWITNHDFIKAGKLLSTLNFLKQYFLSFRVSCMAIGGIAAYLLYFNKKQWLDILFSKYFQWAAYGILALFLFLGITVKYIQNEFYSCLFAILILNVAGNKKTILSLSHRAVEFLGKISYGIYMFHPLAIIIAFRVSKLFYNKVEGVLPNIMVYSCTLILTIFFAFISFSYFESFFLRLKHRFSVLH